MTAIDTKYSPFRAAAQAAFDELSSESALSFYKLKAQEDIQTVFGASVTVFAWAFQLAELTYAMGAQCRARCEALETTAQTPSQPLPLPMLTLAQVEVEDPWEIEADYEFVEFSPSVVAQADINPTLLLAPVNPSAVVCGPVWNLAPKDMHAEVARLLELQHVPLMLAPVIEQPEQKSASRARARAQAKQESQPGVVDEPATALNVPGATGKGQRKSRAKAGRKAVAKPKEARVWAGAK